MCSLDIEREDLGAGSATAGRYLLDVEEGSKASPGSQCPHSWDVFLGYRDGGKQG